MLRLAAVAAITTLLALDASAATLRTIQRGVVTLPVGTGAAQAVTVAINPVDMARSVLFFDLRGDSEDTGDGEVRGQLTSPTQLTFSRGNDSSLTALTISWKVVEFGTGVSVQRGTLAATSTSTATIAPVNPASSFVMVSNSAGAAEVSYGDNDFMRARLTSATTLEVVHSTASPSPTEWQVVEYTGASVQRGIGLMAAGTGTAALPLTTAVNTARAMVLLSWRTDSAGTGTNALRGGLTNGGTLTIDRLASTSILDYAWEVVEFSDGTTVQSGTLNFDGATTSQTATLTSAPLAQSVELLSGAGSRWGGRHSFVTNDQIGPGMFTTVLTNATTLTVARQLTGGALADATWFVPTWSAPSSTDLQVSGTVNPSLVAQGGTLTCALTVRNGGAAPANNVNVVATLPAGMTFSSGAGTGWTCAAAGATLTCSRPLLNAATTAPTLTIQLGAPATPGVVTVGFRAAGSEADPTLSNDTVSLSSTVTGPDLKLSVVDSPDPVLAGANLNYTVTVTNSGNAAASAVTVKDTLPAGSGYLSSSGAGWTFSQAAGVVTCTLPTLAAGASAAFNVVASAPASGPAVDTAVASSTENDANAADNTATATTTVNPSADLAVTLTDSPDPVVAGARLTYTIGVSNLGPSAGAALSVIDTLPPGCSFVSAAGTGWTCGNASGTVTCTLPTLAVGAAPPITLIVDAAPDATTLSDTASVSATSFDPSPGNGSATTTTVVTASADLAVALTRTPEPVAVGGALTFSLQVNDLGPSTATSIRASLTLPPGTSYASASGTGWSCSEASLTVTCLRAALTAGPAPAITVLANLTATSGTLTTTALVSAAEPDPAGGNNSASVTSTVSAVADLNLTLVDAPDPVVAGATLTYSLGLMNLGPSTATAVSVSQLLAAGATFVSASGAGWSCTPGAGSVGCTLPSLPVGNANVITITVKAPAAQGAATSSATARAAEPDPSASNNSASASTTVTGSADLSVAVTDSADPITAGGTLTWTLKVTNAGPSAAGSLTLLDTLPSGVTFKSAAGSGWACAAANGVVTCTLPSLAPGPAADVLIAATVLGNPRTLSDVAAVSAIDSDPAPGNNSAAQPTVVTAAADLAVTLAVKKDPLVAGGAVTFLVGVTNLGPSDASAVAATLTLPAGFQYLSATGATCTASGQDVTCALAAMTAGATASLALQALAVEGTVQAGASIAAAEPDPVVANNAAKVSLVVAPAADLSVTLTGAPRLVGHAAQFTELLTIENAGPGSAQAVAVTLSVPGAQIVTASGMGWTCKENGDRVDCTLPSLARGLAPPISVALLAPTRSATLVSAATVSSQVSDPVSVNDVAQATTLVGTPLLDIAATQLTVTPATARAGATLACTLAVKNGGDIQATHVSVRLPVPDGAAFVDGSARPPATPPGPFELGTLLPGETRTVVLGLLVSASNLGAITTLASISADSLAPFERKVTTPVEADPTLALTLAALPSELENGAPSTVTAQISGGTLPSGAALSLTFPAGLSLVAGSVLIHSSGPAVTEDAAGFAIALPELPAEGLEVTFQVLPAASVEGELTLSGRVQRRGKPASPEASVQLSVVTGVALGTGCGCTPASSAPLPLLAGVLLALSALRRRRV